MSWEEEMRKEIKPIRERNITVKLSDADCDKCWFGMFPEQTLLNHLLCWGYEPQDYLDTMENIETAREDKKYLEEHPEEADEEEVSFLDDDIADWEEKLNGMREDWKPETEPNMDEEIALIKKWIAEREGSINATKED